MVEKGSDIHLDHDYVFRWSNENGHIEIVKFLLNFDLEYFSNNELARNIVIKHKLIEFYEKFNIK